ncbi:MAG TPA: aldehyde dehydrogenase family protein [Candidatus Limnocylindrales bacterium]|nr:aldehyde dehydrogenase family protein [Candidatus Limnocylindrales bacterium]
MRVFDKVLIAGEWVTPHGSGFFDVINPTTEEACGRIPRADTRDVDAAVTSARAALLGWKLTPAAERGRCLRAIADEMDARAAELADVIVEELGSPAAMTAQYMVGFPASTIRFYADLLEKNGYAFEERIGNSVVIREPKGVVAAITPWNYPIHQITAKVGPALAAGCTVVVKPSCEVALSCFLFAEIAGRHLPPGVFNFLSGKGSEIGEAMATHPQVDMVSLTGSTEVGRKIMALAAQSIKDVSLELGGKAANIILDDADPAVISAGVHHAYTNAGQTCAAWTRMLVPRSMHEEACRVARHVAENVIIPGDPRTPPEPGTTRMGPQVSRQQYETVLGYIRAGIDEGARLVAGGTEPPPGLTRGYFVRPTVFGEVRPEMRIAQEEIFGPVLTIMPYEDEDDAVRIANSTIFGLGGAIWSKDVDRAMAVGRRIDTGGIDINGGTFNTLAPFRGIKQSGIGAELGVAGLEEYLTTKSFQLPIDGKIAAYLEGRFEARR